MVSMAAVRVGARMQKGFVDAAMEEALRNGERFTGAFLLACFVETVGGMYRAILAAGLGGRGEDWRAARCELETEARARKEKRRACGKARMVRRDAGQEGGAK